MRIWQLHDDEDGQRRFAEMLSDGLNRRTIADEFNINVDTVSEWRKRPQIATRVKKLNDDRANQIVSKVDSRLMKRLESDDDIPTQTLLAIRQTVAGTIIQNKGDGGDDAAAMAELMKAAHVDPVLAEKLAGLGIGDSD